MRARFSPERIVELAGKLAESAESEQVRLSALQMIAERSHGKVTEKHEVTAMQAGAEEDDDRDLDALDVEQLAELLAAEREFEARRIAIIDRPTLTLGAPSGAGLDGVTAK